MCNHQEPPLPVIDLTLYRELVQVYKGNAGLCNIAHETRVCQYDMDLWLDGLEVKN
jgi:hypothetical protein